MYVCRKRLLRAQSCGSVVDSLLDSSSQTSSTNRPWTYNTEQMQQQLLHSLAAWALHCGRAALCKKCRKAMKFERCSREKRGAAGALARSMKRSPQRSSHVSKIGGVHPTSSLPLSLLSPFRFPRTTQRLTTSRRTSKKFQSF